MWHGFNSVVLKLVTFFWILLWSHGHVKCWVNGENRPYPSTIWRFCVPVLKWSSTIGVFQGAPFSIERWVCCFKRDLEKNPILDRTDINRNHHIHRSRTQRSISPKIVYLPTFTIQINQMSTFTIQINQIQVKLGKYTIHGSYGFRRNQSKDIDESHGREGWANQIPAVCRRSTLTLGWQTSRRMLKGAAWLCRKKESATVSVILIAFYCHWFGYTPRYWWQMPSHVWFLVYQGNPSNRLLRQIWLVWDGNYGISKVSRTKVDGYELWQLWHEQQGLPWSQHPFIPHMDCKSSLLRFSRCRCQPFAFPTFPNPPTISGEKKLIHTPNKNPPLKHPQKSHGKSGIH